MTIKEINQQISELKIQRDELEKREIDEHQELAKRHIGRCFKINGNRYAKVIGVPLVRYKMVGIEYNKYQYPALYLGYDTDLISGEKSFVPFYKDDLFSAAWGEGTDFINEYEEITPEEFVAVFEEKLAEFRKQIGV